MGYFIVVLFYYFTAVNDVQHKNLWDFIKGEKNKVSQRCLTDLNNTAQKYESLYGVKPLEVYEYSFEKTPTFTKKR